jgi:hypothetical protein
MKGVIMRLLVILTLKIKLISKTILIFWIKLIHKLIFLLIFNKICYFSKLKMYKGKGLN